MINRFVLGSPAIGLKTNRVLMGVLVLFSIALLGRFVYFEYNLLKYPYQWGLREGLQLNHAILISEGKPLYTINSEPPLVIEPYGPINPYLVAPLLKVLGRNLLAPRLVSLISFLLVLSFIAYLVLRLTHSWQLVLVSMGLTLFMLHNIQRILLCRPDGLGNFLLFVTIFLHWKFPYKKMAISASFVMGILAFFTKIYFVSGFGSIILSYWLVHKDKKMALLYLIFSSGFLLSSFLIVNYMSNGLYYLFTFEILIGWVSYSLKYMFANLKGLISYYLPIFVLISFVLFKKSFDYKRYGVLFTHLVLGMALFSLLLLSEGGGFFYWFSVIPVLVIIGCDLIHLETKKLNHTLLVPVLIGVMLVMVLRVGYRDMMRKKFIMPSQTLAREWEPIERLVRRSAGPVINDESTAIINIRAGKKLYNEGLPYLSTRNYLIKKYNHSFVDINKEIAQEKFALIINPEDEETVKKYYDLLRTYYVPTEFGKWKIKLNLFIPKSRLVAVE